VSRPGAEVRHRCPTRAKKGRAGHVCRLVRAGGAKRSFRCSLWIRTPDGWRLLFHQGTPGGGSDQELSPSHRHAGGLRGERASAPRRAPFRHPALQWLDVHRRRGRASGDDGRLRRRGRRRRRADQRRHEDNIYTLTGAGSARLRARCSLTRARRLSPRRRRPVWTTSKREGRSAPIRRREHRPVGSWVPQMQSAGPHPHAQRVELAPPLA
jgi:hypothetical protein